MKKIIFIMLVFILPSVLAVPSYIGVNGLKFQYANGSNIDEAFNSSFIIFDAYTAGNILFNYTGEVTYFDGASSITVFNVNDTVFVDNPLTYLEVWINGTKLTPRHNITSVPYSLVAGMCIDTAGISITNITDANWLNDTTTFGGEVSGTYGSIDVLDNVSKVYCGNITGATSDLCTLTPSAGSGNCSVPGSCMSNAYMNYANIGNFTVADGNMTSLNDSWCNSTACYSIGDFLLDTDTDTYNESQEIWDNVINGTVMQYGNVGCGNITGGSDADFCTDADTDTYNETDELWVNLINGTVMQYGNVGCGNITGGSDADFCTDADTDTYNETDELWVNLINGTIMQYGNVGCGNLTGGSDTDFCSDADNYNESQEIWDNVINGTIMQYGDVGCGNLTGGSDADFCTDADTDTYNETQELWDNVVNNGTFQYNLTAQNCSGTDKIVNVADGIFGCAPDINTDTNCTNDNSCPNITYWDDVPTCGAGEYLYSSDGLSFTCDTPAGGGGGTSSSWIDKGTFFDTNSSQADGVNASIFYASYGTNMSSGGITSGGSLNASAFYDDGVLLQDTTVGNCSVSGSCSNPIYKNYNNLGNLTIDDGNITSMNDSWCNSTACYTIGQFLLDTDTDTIINNCSVDTSCSAITYDSELAYIGNCSGRDCEIGWSNITGEPDFLLNNTNTNFTESYFGNITIYYNMTVWCSSGYLKTNADGGVYCDSTAVGSDGVHAGDGIYIYNDSTKHYLNETKLNITVNNTNVYGDVSGTINSMSVIDTSGLTYTNITNAPWITTNCNSSTCSSTTFNNSITPIKVDNATHADTCSAYTETDPVYGTGISDFWNMTAETLDWKNITGVTDVVNDDEMNYTAVTLADFTNDANFIANLTAAILSELNLTGDMYVQPDKCIYFFNSTSLKMCANATVGALVIG